MSRIVALLTAVFLLLSSALFAQSFTSASVYGSGQTEHAEKVVTDANGYSYVTGWYRYIDFGNGITITSVSGFVDVFLAKFDPQGNCMWAVSAGGPNNDFVHDMAIGPNGNLYLCGSGIDMDFGSISTSWLGGNGSDAFIAKYDTSGTCLWAEIAGGTISDQAMGIDVDQNGNVYVVGEGSANSTVGGNFVSSTSDGWVAKFNTTGVGQWATSLGDITNPRGVAVTAAGHPVVTGYIQSTTNIGCATVTSNGQLDLFLAQFNTNGGGCMWHQQVGSAQGESGAAVNVAPNGDILVAGMFRDNLNWGSCSLSHPGSTANNAFVARTNASGQCIWLSDAYGGNIGVEDMDMAADGSVLVGGWLENTVTFGPFAGVSSGGRDGYISRFDAAGNCTGVLVVNAPSDNCHTLGVHAAEATGELMACGYTEGQTIFGSITIPSTNNVDAWISLAPDSALIPGPNTISGHIWLDSLQNCTQDAQEPDLANQLIKVTPGPIYVQTDSAGNYTVPVGQGTYTVEQLLPSSNASVVSQVCPGPTSTYNVTINGFNIDTAGFDFANDIEDCAFLTVDIATSRRRRCFPNRTVLVYRNEGLLPAYNAQLEVVYPDLVTPLSADVPWTSSFDSLYTWNLDTVWPGEIQTIRLWDSVACIDSIIGLTVCTEAQITPATTCFPAGPNYDNSELEAFGSCQNDNVVLLHAVNTGTGNMTDSTEYRVYYDSLLVITGMLQLDAGDSLTIMTPAGGQTVRLEVDQNADHPLRSQTSVMVEGCGIDTIVGISTGYIAQFEQDDEAPNVAISCLPIVDSYDPNDKTSGVTGFTSSNFITADQSLDYKIRFQNTGSDTAYTVILKDTLSPSVDVASFQPGAASHDYLWTIDGDGVAVVTFTFNNIDLVDSATNEPLSHGFVHFTIEQTPNNPIGTVIENQVDIYFDFNAPIPTNTVSHTIGNFSVTDLTAGLGAIVDGKMQLDAGPDQVICLGDTTTIGTDFTTPTGTVISWSLPNTVVDPNATQTQAAPPISASYVLTTDFNGIVTTDTVAVTLSLPPANAGADSSVCLGNAIQLQASGGQSYAWLGASDLNDSTIANPSALPDSTTTYTVVVTDSIGCTATDQVDIAVLPLPTVIAIPGLTSCPGDSVTLIANGAATYSWSPAAGVADPTAATTKLLPATSGLLIVTGTDSFGCINADTTTVTVYPAAQADAGADDFMCAGDSVQLSATGGVSQSWSDGQYLNDSTAANPFATAPETTTFVVTVTDTNGCHATDSVLLVVEALPTANAGADAAVCAGDSVQLNATGNALLEWAASASLSNAGSANPWATPTTDEWFVVTATSDSGCTNSDSVLVAVIPLPQPTVDTTAIPALTGGSFDAYQWYFDGQLLAGATDSAYVVTETGNYYLVVTEQGCSNGSDTVFVQLTGIDHVQAAHGWQLFPNPTAAVVTIAFDEPVLAQIEVLDLRGRSVKQVASTGRTRVQVDVSDLSSGVYVVSVVHNGSRSVQRLVVK